MPYPCVCPECRYVRVGHTTTYPGSPDARVTLSCPECRYTETFDEEPGRNVAEPADAGFPIAGKRGSVAFDA